MTNLLIAIKNLIQTPIPDLVEHYQGTNRANNMGDALETYVKDAFCNSFNLTNPEKDQLYHQNFSYLGNQNNPPDIIIKQGDAIEVKKI
ncbi:MAG: NgoPII family restriction endonuclease, partial [Candidatus Peribacteria bacterium]|nr:NgoPII family restriction endonuclease [Candidatus Peribacteria bacterium]